MAVNKRLMGLGTAEVAGIKASENFETVLYTGTGSTQSITGGWIGKSGKFNGSSSYVSVDKSVFGTGDGTADVWSFSMWFKTDGTISASRSLVGTKGNSSTSGLYIYMISGGQIRYYEGDGTANSQQLTTTNDFDDSNWHHLAVTRNSSNQVAIYVDGTEEVSATTMTSPHSSHSYNLHIGRYAATGLYYWDGLLDQVRIFDRALSSDEVTTLYEENSSPVNPDIVSGCVALYEFEDNVKDTANNGALKAIDTTDKAASFNGNDSYVDTGATLLGQTYTVSLWFNANTITSSTDGDVLYAQYDSADTGRHIVSIYNGNLRIFVGGQTVQTISTTWSTSTWTHLVVVKDSSGYEAFVNGDSIGTSSLTTNIDVTENTMIGGDDGLSTYSFDGLIDDVRIYSDALDSDEVGYIYNNTTASIPSDNLEAYYKLDGNALDETSNDNDGAVNNVTYVQSLVKGTESLDNGKAAHFNGSSSYIGVPTGVRQNNNFTFSFWFNTNSTSVAQVPVSFRNGKKFQITFNGSIGNGAIRVNAGDNTAVTSSAGIFTANTWHHLAVTQSSTNGCKVYLDSNIIASDSSATGDLVNVTGRDVIGAYYSTSYTNFFDGELDDARMFDSALSADAVNALYANDTSDSDFPDSPVAHYKLDGNALDETGDYDGTPSNVVYGYDGTNTSNLPTYSSALGFTPDLVWIKDRDNSFNPHELSDSVRGVTGTLNTNTTNAEYVNASFQITSLDDNGFTVVDDSAGNYAVNGNNIDYVAWCFKAGGTAVDIASDCTGVSSATRSVNTAAGFSIVKITANAASQNIAHGLNSTPELFITKRTSSTSDWVVYNTVVSGKGRGFLNKSDAFDNVAVPTFDDTDVTNLQWASGDTAINYIFHSVDGHQKVGTYTGNGTSKDIVTGFQPRFLLMKNADNASGNWVIFDSIRGVNKRLFPDLSNAENTITTQLTSFNSNGFSVGSNTNVNGLNNTIIYLAIAADADTTTPVLPKSFDVTTYTGNATARSIETRFKPDLVWIKSRDRGTSPYTGNHFLYDSIRGALQRIKSNSTDAENTFTNSLTSFDSNGFSLGTANHVNYNNDDFVAWTWKAGDHDDNLPEINTNGTIESTVSVNDAAGFSIVKYTGTGSLATVGHGLSSAPELIIIKNLDDATRSWLVYDKINGATKNMSLNSTAASAASSAAYNDTEPTAEVFTVNTSTHVNAEDDNHIAYCWYSVSGYSKIGSYSGTGVSGKEVATGFEPDFVMIKRTNAASAQSSQHWLVFDSQRLSSGEPTMIRASSSDSEFTGNRIEFLSNGFRLDDTDDSRNGSGGTYIYMAFKIN